MNIASSTSGCDQLNIVTGRVIPTLNYSDQPYIVQAADGAWVCVVTTGTGEEGEPGQTVISLRSLDEGGTWEPPVFVEPSDGPEASYAVALRTPSGRIYVFYNHNTDRVREIPREDQGVYTRVDSLGRYVFKYSDDHGRSWSSERYEVPIRLFAIDRENPYAGDLVRFFWNVGRPLIAADGSVFLPHSKVGAMGVGFYARSEGVFLRSPNILNEGDPRKIIWETLPDGEVGLRPPPGMGRVAEEHTIVELSDRALFTVYRTVGGYPAQSYSRDSGHTWEQPVPMRYHPAKPRLIKHPRAANFLWKCSNGRFLYWFHNHGGPAKTHLGADWIGEKAYHGRNPAWISAGREVATPHGKAIAWSQPEILLYDADPLTRISYPDLVESEDGRFWITETQKTTARVHPVPPRLLSLLFRQHELERFAEEGLLLHAPSGPRLAFPLLREFRSLSGKLPPLAENARAGFTLDFTLTIADVAGSTAEVLIDTLSSHGEGLRLTLTSQRNGRRALTVEMADDRQHTLWTGDSFPMTGGTEPIHVSMIVDAGPRLILFIVDGELQDGGVERQFGWGLFSPTLRHCNGKDSADLSPTVGDLRIYGRALTVSEAIGNARASKLVPKGGPLPGSRQGAAILSKHMS